MEYGNMQANLQQAGTNPKEMTRSEKLVASWERFAAADFELYNSRQNVIACEKNVGIAYEQRNQAEQVWSKASQELGALMMTEAPAQVQTQVAAEIAALKSQRENVYPPTPTPAPGFSSGGNAGTPRY